MLTALLAREALLAALADVTVVIEATRGAGALRVAEAALELGRTLAAVPGRTSDACVAGSNLLIRDGAHVVLETADVLALLKPGARRERCVGGDARALRGRATHAGAAGVM